MIDTSERLFRDDVLMIIRPALDHRVEHSDQFVLIQCFVPFDRRAYFLQEGCHIRFRRFDQQLAAVLADVLAQKIEALVNVRDLGLLGRERQPPFPS